MALPRHRIEIAVLAAPADRAYQVTEMLLKGGVKAILNYAPVSLRAPAGITVRSIDPVLVLQSLTFYLNIPGLRGGSNII